MPSRPPRTNNRFRERELARAVKAVRQAGGGEVRLDPATGEYVIKVPPKGEAKPGPEANEWDKA